MAMREDPERRDLTMTMTTGFDDRAARGRLVVRVVAGPDRGRFVALGDASLVVGASDNADLPLKDPGVSRRHLEIAVVEGGVRVVDLKSKNGTLLMGARLDTALVTVGAELVLGHTTLRIDDADALEDQVEADTLGPLVTNATSMRRLFGALDRIKGADIHLLLEGEPDVGHGAVARAFHAASSRAAGPLRVVSFANVKREDASNAVLDAFDKAHGGTVVLEDIELTHAHIQTPLAKMIETGVLPAASMRDGKPKRVSVRVVATTTKDVDAEIRAGRLLAELRNVFTSRLAVPPLRERMADLDALVADTLAQLGASAGALDDAARAKLRAHRWPGNLAELKQVLARSIAAGGDVAIDTAAATTATLRDERDKFERDKLVELLRAHGDNVSAAARAAGIDRRHLHRLLKKHGLRGHE